MNRPGATATSNYVWDSFVITADAVLSGVHDHPLRFAARLDRHPGPRGGHGRAAHAEGASGRCRVVASRCFQLRRSRRPVDRLRASLVRRPRPGRLRGRALRHRHAWTSGRDRRRRRLRRRHLARRRWPTASACSRPSSAPTWATLSTRPVARRSPPKPSPPHYWPPRPPPYRSPPPSTPPPPSAPPRTVAIPHTPGGGEFVAVVPQYMRKLSNPALVMCSK